MPLIFVNKLWLLPLFFAFLCVFDEIQACIPAISSLRFFYEKLPRLLFA